MCVLLSVVVAVSHSSGEESAHLPVYERLLRYGEMASARIDNKRQQAEAEQLNGITFTPSISASSKQRVKSASRSRSVSVSRQRSGTRALQSGCLVVRMLFVFCDCLVHVVIVPSGCLVVWLCSVRVERC